MTQEASSTNGARQPDAKLPEPTRASRTCAVPAGHDVPGHPREPKSGVEDEELLARLAMSHTANLSPRWCMALVDALGSARAVLATSPAELVRLGVPESARAALAAPDWAAAHRSLDWRDAPERCAPRHVMTFGPEFGDLRHISSPPLVLHVEGDAGLLSSPQLAIVGSRRASRTGLDFAHRLAAELAGHGLTVISGLATGIDTAAHGGALSAGGATLAVLGCGNAICYPRRNAALRDAIARHGAVVSEYAPDAAPLPYRFPRRNRIIAGLARGVVVVQADLKSGSLITARMALDENREVFAVPGAVQDPLSRGCHALIRDGARLVEGIEDIFDELPSLAQGAPRMDVETVPGRTAERGLSSVEDLSGDALKALACLDAVPLSVDELARLCGRSVAATAALLTRLELAGVAGRVPGEGYIRTSWSAGE